MTEARHSQMRRAIPLLFTTCLLIGPAQAQYSGGTGEPNDPYQIATATDLIALGETPEDYDRHFILTADMDLDPNLCVGNAFYRAVIAPDIDEDEPWMFQGVPFTGVFDGSGHTISHLTIVGESYLGLFGLLESGAEVKNLGLIDVSITGSGSCVAGLAGKYGRYGVEGGFVTRCFTTGSVAGGSGVGGLLGSNSESAIVDCHNSSKVSGTTYVGGLVGINSRSGRIVTSYSTGAVSGDELVGGLAGENYGGAIASSYSTGAVSGNELAGGLVGYSNGSITYCFSAGMVRGAGDDVGGFVGSCRWESVTGCFWDVETSGQATSAGGSGRATTEMQMAVTLTCPTDGGRGIRSR